MKKTIFNMMVVLICMTVVSINAASAFAQEKGISDNIKEQDAVIQEDGSIYFPESSDSFVKAKYFYGYYILMDTDVIFALNEDETRFAVKFNGIGGRMPMYMEGDVHEDGTVKADDTYNGLFGEDIQTMYEDALEEEMDWAPIVRDISAVLNEETSNKSNVQETEGAEKGFEQIAYKDIFEYLWDMGEDLDEEEFEIARKRNYKIITEMQPLFTEESYHQVYVANVHLNQKRDGAKEEFLNAVNELEQVKSVEKGITFLWDAKNMPVFGNKEYSEEQLDGGQLDGYGFIPYMINYLLDDPSQAKGNILLFSGGSRTNSAEAFPTAVVFNKLGYNCFVVNCRMNPYTSADADYDAQRALRMVKYCGEQNGWGGMDAVVMCGFSAGGLRVINNIENGYIIETPDELGADSYVADEIDAVAADMNVAILVYTGKDQMLAETGHWPALIMIAGSEDATGATQRLEAYYEYTKDIVPSELIVYEGAGHGFGSGQEGSSFATEETAGWPAAADEFIQANLGYNQAFTKASAEPDDPAAGTASAIDISTETGSVTVEYYDGKDVLQTDQDGDILVQVPDGIRLDNISIYANNGEINIIGVIADSYDLETVHDDINIYLPEDTAFHVQLTTISDLFESDFLFDVTMQRHEYIFGEDGVNITMETIIGVARVMILQ